MFLQSPRKIRHAIAVVTVGLLFVFIGGYLLFPAYLQNRLLPDLAKKAGFTLDEIEVRRIGWFGADLGPIRVSRHHTTGWNLAAVQISYSPLTLIRRKIDAVALIGLHLEIRIEESGIIVSGIKINPEPAQPGSEAQHPLQLGSLLPLGVDRMILRNSVVDLKWGRHSLETMVDVELDTADLANGIAKASLSCSARGNTITINARLDSRTNQTHFTLSGRGLNPAVFADLLKEATPVSFSGSLDLAAKGSLQVSPFQMNEFWLDASFDELVIRNGEFVLETIRTTTGEALPLRFTLEASAPDHWQITSSPLRLSRPIPMDLPALQMTIVHRSGAWEFEGSASSVLASFSGGEATVPKAGLSGRAMLDRSKQLRIRLDLPQPTFKHNDVSASADLIALEIDALAEQGQAWSAQGKAELIGGRADIPRQAITIDQLAFQMPLHWPLAAKSPQGRLKADIRWNKQPFGTLSGTLQHYDFGLRANLSHRSQLFPGMNVLIHADAKPGGVTVNLDLPPYQPEKGIDLGRYFPAAAGAALSGKLQAQAALSLNGLALEGRGRLQLNQGRLTHSKKELALEGISLELAFDDLPSLRSAPGQPLRIAGLRLGNIAAQKFNADFQIEPGGTLLIEKAAMLWSDGTLNTQALRIRPEMQDFEITLFCDRLNLASVLAQLGAAQGSGEGTVSGLIPMRWHNNQLIFDNGFLFSTPGQSGTIHLQDTHKFLQGLPPGTPQYTQLDIATEALKDYTYNWAKLHLNSEKEILLVRLQLDGHPNQLLPFAYDTGQGTFMRAEGAGQAEFKGIAIDLNFRSPFNQLLDYRKLLNPGDTQNR